MTCGATMRSEQVKGHTHYCTGTHDSGDHKCADPACRRWFFQEERD